MSPEATNEGILPLETTTDEAFAAASSSSTDESGSYENPSSRLLNPEGEISDTLIKLIRDIMKFTLPDSKLSNVPDLLDEMEKSWARTGERTDEQTDKFDSAGSEILKLADELGFCEPVEAEGEFDIAYVYGSSPLDRLPNLIEAIKSGKISVGKIVISSTSAVEIRSHEAQALGYEPTEIGDMKFVFDKILLSLSVKNQALLRGITVFVDNLAPEGLTRPHTGHGIAKFLQSEDIKSETRILAVSNQPFVEYQGNIFRIISHFIGKEVTVTNFGKSVEDSFKPSLMLDTIFRTLATEEIIRMIESEDIEGARALTEKYLKVRI